MNRWGEIVRNDPRALMGRSASALHELLDEVDEGLGHPRRSLLVEVPSDRPVQVIGDSHGDWPAVAAALRFARQRAPAHRFVGLGDYIHRATWAEPDPSALPTGSIWNAAYLLAWTIAVPEEVILLRGNHEATRQIPVPAPTLLRELRRAYPRKETLALWERLIELLERLPLAARTANGVFMAHGGIRTADQFDPKMWNANDARLLEGLLWSDPEFEYEDRSVGQPYSAQDLERFLQAIGCRWMIKGHAPGHSGRAIYGGRLLTIHTSDLFARLGEGGTLLAEIPAGRRLDDIHQIALRSWDGVTWRPRRIRVVAEPAATDLPSSVAEGDSLSPSTAPGS